MKAQEVARQLDTLAAAIRECTLCPLCASRTHAVPGDGPPRAAVMIIGEGPGREEDASGHPFIGASGRFLNEVLAGTNLDRNDLFITNIVKCRPPQNRTPRKLEIDTCTAHYLFRQITLVDPALVMLLGSVAAKKILGVKSIALARGRVLEHEGRAFIVGYHPAVRFYREDLEEKVKEDFTLMRDEIERRGLGSPKPRPRAGRHRSGQRTI